MTLLVCHSAICCVAPGQHIMSFLWPSCTGCSKQLFLGGRRVMAEGRVVQKEAHAEQEVPPASTGMRGLLKCCTACPCLSSCPHTRFLRPQQVWLHFRENVQLPSVEWYDLQE